MATTVKESVDYPMISTSAWWKLRKQLQQTMPPRVTVNTLASFFGMTPKSVGIDLLSPLRKMGLIDSEGRTTDLANRWRDDSQYPLVCEEIRKALYPRDLLDTFPGPDSPLFTLILVSADSVLPHLSCSTFAPLVRKEKQKEHMFSSGAFHCIHFPFLYPASR